jgi:cytochrome P450 family 135
MASVRRASPPRSALPPGPKEPALLQTVRFYRKPLDFLLAARERYGEPFTVNLLGFGTGVVVTDPAIVHRLVTGNPETFHGGEANAPLAPVMGRYSLFMLDGPLHLEHRRLLLPPLHGKRIEPYGELMSRLVDEEIATWRDGMEFRLHDRMLALTLEVILRVVFGVTNDERLEEMRGIVPTFLKYAERVVFWGLLTTRDVPLFRPRARYLEVKERLDRLVYAEIAEHRPAPDLAERGDVMSTLCQATHEDGSPMSDVEIRDELVTALMAGHHSTGTAVTWAMELLLRHPAAVDRLREDLASGSENYLDAVVRESLRVRPTIAFIGRVIDKPEEFAGVTLPPDSTVAASLIMLHLREDTYPDALAFKPERFVDSKGPAHAWLPFGGGVRRCVGAALAEHEMRRVIPKLIDAGLETVSDKPDRMVPAGVIVIPGRGVRVRVNRKTAGVARPVAAAA